MDVRRRTLTDAVLYRAKLLLPYTTLKLAMGSNNSYSKESSEVEKRTANIPLRAEEDDKV